MLNNHNYFSVQSMTATAVFRMIQDFRIACRSLLRAPGFAAACVLTLAVAIGKGLVALQAAVLALMLVVCARHNCRRRSS
jgi:hypothetical protein